MFYSNPFYSRNPTKSQYSELAKITIEKLSKIHKMPSKRRKFPVINFQKFHNLFFSHNEPKSSKNITGLPDSHTIRIPPSASALAETTYYGRFGIDKRKKLQGLSKKVLTSRVFRRPHHIILLFFPFIFLENSFER